MCEERQHGGQSITEIRTPVGTLRQASVRSETGNTCIIGGIEPTNFLNLAEKALAGYVEQVIADGSGGAFVLANSDSCPPGVSIDKFKIVAEVAKAHKG